MGPQPGVGSSVALKTVLMHLSIAFLNCLANLSTLLVSPLSKSTP